MLSFVMPHEEHRVRTLIINVSSIEYGHHGMVKVKWPDFKMMEWKKTSTNNNIASMGWSPLTLAVATAAAAT